MKLVIISGLSGSGKSIALETLEDCGYYCIDNLPVALLEAFIKDEMIVNREIFRKTAIGIDARNESESLSQFASTLAMVRQLGIGCEVIYLQAEPATLLKRFSETRRKHPLTSARYPLSEAIELERQLLETIAREADLLIDTTHTNVHQLRDLVRQRVNDRAHQLMSLYFLSFGFKKGPPLDADFIFDARCLPNPHWEPALRSLTGKDPDVIEFLSRSAEVEGYLNDIIGFLERWIPRFEAENRSYLTVAIGCTGGQHRSVYLVETLGRHFQTGTHDILIRHRELG